MPQFFLNKKLITILITIIVVVVVVGYTARDRLNLTWPEKFIKDTTNFVQMVIDKPVNFFTGVVDHAGSVQNALEENEKLKKELDSQVQLETQVYELEKENEELKALNGLENKDDAEYIGAKVIGRSSDMWHEYVTIDKGSKSGIEANMAVVTADGLVGKVKTTNTFSSTVQLLTSLDSTNRISAEVQGETPVYGVIEGYNEETGTLQLTVNLKADIKVGSNVISSGLGTVFPPGLLIGKVTNVELDEYGLSKVAEVQPYADLNDFGYVKVVKRTDVAATDGEGDL